MLGPIVNTFKNFRDRIYDFFCSRRDAAFELIDALSSNTSAKSVVELSLNPLHRRNHCSITRVLDEFYANGSDKKSKNDELTKIISEQCLSQRLRKYFLFAVDCTPNPRRYAPTQEDRGFVYAPNTISGNKPVTIGHQYSVVTFLPEKIDVNSPPWVIPLSCYRVKTIEKSAIVGMKQISQCIQSQEVFKDTLCVSVGDSAYSNADPISEANKNSQQIHISRVRNNRVLHYAAIENGPVKRGRKKCFGDQFRLRDKATWKTPDETMGFEMTSKKRKQQVVKIECWNDIVMRGTTESNISKQPLRLLRICVYKSSGELLFKKPLWLIVAGEKRFALSLREVFDCYRQRFDIEHFFRFGKNKLLMDKSQTPDVNHEEAWWQLIMVAYTQLYLARELAKNIPTPWERHLPTFIVGKEISPTHVQKDFGRIIQVIGTPAKPLKPLKKSPGRKKGNKQTARTRYPIVQKSAVLQLTAGSG